MRLGLHTIIEVLNTSAYKSVSRWTCSIRTTRQNAW